ncbi:unnamed protein product [Larinioides sclopetarius]|uniref:Uncharacterized protein n=1 Tax=Larinioides sclopetarius TaxID=280406 RepID=A0AAV2B1S7_9ARAC
MVHYSFTIIPFWDYWNTGKENLSSRSKNYEIWSKWSESGLIKTKSKSKNPSVDSISGSGCQANRTTNDLPTLELRVEVGNETQNPSRG